MQIDTSNLPDTLTPKESEVEGLTLDIGMGYGISMKFMEDRIQMRVHPVDDEDGGEFYDTVSRDFFESRQKRRTAANQIAYDCDLDSEWVKSRLRDVQQFLDEADRVKLSDDARDILERTNTVEGYKTGEGISVVVWMEAPPSARVDGERKIHFDGAGEWMTDSADTLQQKHYSEFFEKVAISDDDWQHIWDAWDDEMELEQSGGKTEAEIDAERVSDALASRVAGQVYDEREVVPRDDMNVYYERGDESRYEEDTVWVQPDALHTVIESKTQTSPSKYLAGKLSEALKMQDITLDSAQERRFGGEKMSVYPFSADALGITEEDVRTHDEDAEQDTDSQAGDGDDGREIKP